MAQTKSSRGTSDRNRVAGGQKWEVSYMKDKFGVSSQQVSGAITAVGNDRKKVEDYLKQKSNH